MAHAQGKAVDWHEGADSGSRTHDIRLETSDDNHFTISAGVLTRRVDLPS